MLAGKETNKSGEEIIRACYGSKNAEFNSTSSLNSFWNTKVFSEKT